MYWTDTDPPISASKQTDLAHRHKNELATISIKNGSIVFIYRMKKYPAKEVPSPWPCRFPIRCSCQGSLRTFATDVSSFPPQIRRSSARLRRDSSRHQSSCARCLGT